jgi:hypothetical protein
VRSEVPRKLNAATFRLLKGTACAGEHQEAGQARGKGGERLPEIVDDGIDEGRAGIPSGIADCRGVGTGLMGF